jgi:tripartite-type tricarboxylate transporter receptor subunit TctC
MVDNRAGAGGNIGMEAAAKSAPDGRTLVIVDNGTLAMNPHLYDRTGYDALADFIPVVRLVEAPLMLAVRADLPARSVADLIRLAKEKPGQLTYGSPGVGTPPHLANELFKRTAGIDVAHVPYKGSGPLNTDLLGAQVPLGVDGLGGLSDLIGSGKVKALAVLAPKRSPLAPDVPSLGDMGINDVDGNGWYGALVPAGTPPNVVARLHSAFAAALKAPEVQERLTAIGVEPVGTSSEEFRAYLVGERKKWAEVIKSANIKPE